MWMEGQGEEEEGKETIPVPSSEGEKREKGKIFIPDYAVSNPNSRHFLSLQ